MLLSITKAVGFRQVREGAVKTLAKDQFPASKLKTWLHLGLTNAIDANRPYQLLSAGVSDAAYKNTSASVKRRGWFTIHHS